MASRDVSVGVNLIGRDISASKALNKLGIKAKTTGDMLAAASRKSTYVIAGLSAAMYSFAKAAAEDQVSSVKLANTLKTVTGAGQAQIDQVEKFITKAETWSVTADDLIRPAFDRLVRSTKNVGEAQKLTTLALEIAKQKGLPVADVANALAKAHDGNVNALKRIGITVKSATKGQDVYGVRMKVVNGKLEEQKYKIKSASKATITYSELIKQLGKDFNGSINGQAETAAYKLEQVRIVMGRIKETLGYMLLPYLEKFSEWLISVEPWINEHKEVIIKWTVAILGVATALKVLNTAMKVWETLTWLGGLVKATALMTGFGTAAEVAGAKAATAGTVAQVSWLKFLGTVGLVITALKLAYDTAKTMKKDVLPNIWKGIENWGLSLASPLLNVPRHAKGGIVTKPHIGMVGEAGPEAIIPLSKFSSLGGTTINNYVQGSVITQRELAMMTRDSMAQLIRRKGLNPAVLGV